MREDLNSDVPMIALGYADAGSTRFSSTIRRLGLMSLFLSIGSLLCSVLLSLFFCWCAVNARRDIANIPVVGAQLKLQNANNAAVIAKRVADFQNRMAARSARGLPRALTALEVDQVIGVVQGRDAVSDDARHPTLSPVQVAALRKELERSDQQLIDPALPISSVRPTRATTLPAQEISSHPGRNGAVRISMSRLYSATPRDKESHVVEISTDGTVLIPPRPTSTQVLASLQAPGPAPAPWPPPGYAAGRRDLEIRCAIAAALSGANLILAVVLFCGAILALNHSGQWATWHRAFVIGKFSVILPGAAYVGWLVYVSSASEILWTPLILAAPYPLIVLIRLRRRRI